MRLGREVSWGVFDVAKAKRPTYAERKWKDEFYVQAYKLARQGSSNEQIAKVLGVTRGVFDKWRDSRPAFQGALDDARGAHERNEEFVGLLYSRLSETCQDLWDRLVECRPEEKDLEPEVIRDKRRLRIKLEQEVKELETREKQRLYFFAFYSCDFNRSEACRTTGITLNELAKWRTDKDFLKVEREMQDAKKDLYESALVQLVKQGEPSAVVFANKTLNRDRGYNDKVEVDVTTSPGFSVDDLGLSLEERKKILCAIRERQEQKALADRSDVVEAEFTVKGEG